jgi:hypothetical protein
VKSHLSSAFSKLNVASRNEAAALVLDPDEPVGRAVLAAGPFRALDGNGNGNGNGNANGNANGNGNGHSRAREATG